jgi:predicted dehydrogenase
MRVIVLGDDADSALRIEALRSAEDVATDPDLVRDAAARADTADLLAALPLDTAVVFSGGVIPHYVLLTEIARRGVHLFLDWPPASSATECRTLAELAREAGVEIGVSRPLRFHRWSSGGEPFAHVDVVSVQQLRDVRVPGEWKRALEDAVDLALFFARGASPRRIDAAVARSEGRLALVTLAGIRFHNGTYAQIEVRHVEEADPSTALSLGGAGRAVDGDLSGTRDAGIRLETLAFLEAVRANRPPPVTVLDALQTLRLMERLMERLRH